MKNVEEMIKVNKMQAKFYDSISTSEDSEEKTGYSNNQKANFLTKI